MMSTISKWILALAGWKIEGKAPVDLKKYVMIAAPHTSWWDFPLGLLIRSASKLRINYLGKHTLFKPPFGFIFKWTGGFPINRTASHNMVKQIVKYYKEEDRFAIVMAPEGTRKKVKKLKSGFYYIARLAKIPIVMVTFDWEHKVATFSDEFFPSDNIEADLDKVWNHFKGVKGKVPENSIY